MSIIVYEKFDPFDLQKAVSPKTMDQALAKALRDSLHAQKMDHAHFAKNWSGRVVILIGGSTAGKTTMIKELRRLHQDIHEEGVDLTQANYIYSLMEKEYRKVGVTTQDWQHLHAVLTPQKDHWHVHHAVSFGTEIPDHAFVQRATVDDRQRARQTACKLEPLARQAMKDLEQAGAQMLLDQVLVEAKRGYDVVFDFFDLALVKDHSLVDSSSVTTVFTFCRFDQLNQRLAQRNRQALSGETGLEEVRAGVGPFFQYAELIRPIDIQDCREQIVDRITKQQAIQAFEDNYDASLEILRTAPGVKNREELIAQEISRRSLVRQDFLENFGFTSQDPTDRCIEYVPCQSYDLVIDTSSSLLGSSVLEKGRAAAIRILRTVF